MGKQPSDRHKPSRMVRLPNVLVQQLDKAAERHVTNITQETIRAVREYLERIGFWPPQQRKP